MFDLHGATLLFTPDGRGGYAREVRHLTWEESIGEPVADGAEVPIESFSFDFAGQHWGSFHVSRHGLLTFGGPLTYSYRTQGRFETMREIAAEFVDRPTISPLYAPAFGGTGGHEPWLSRRHVAQLPDRVVVTWIVREPATQVRGKLKEPNRFQAVLHADGRVQFNYADITSDYGIAGLFSNTHARGKLIARLADTADPEMPGYRDLLEVAIYETNSSSVIIEFTTRGPIPVPGDGTFYTYRLNFDADEPFWTEWNAEDDDLGLAINVRPGGALTVWRGTPLERQAANQLAVRVDISAVQGGPASLIGSAGEIHDDAWVGSDVLAARTVELPLPAASRTLDLSTRIGRSR